MSRDYTRQREKEAQRAAEEAAEQEERHQRYLMCWQVPDRAKYEYLALEDAIGEDQAKVVLDLITALYGEPT